MEFATAKSFVEAIQNNNNLNTYRCLLGEPGDNDFLEYCKTTYKISYPERYQNFILNFCMNIDLEWALAEKAIAELNLREDDPFMHGTIKLLDPIEIMGETRNYWKGIFWFDEVNSELNDRLKRFVPFDLADGFNYVTGFLKEGNDTDGWVIGEQLYLNIENEELIPHPFTFDEYLEFILKTKGYNNFLGYYNKPDSEQHKRFMRVMPLIFEDFDKEYFIMLTHKS